MRKLSVLIPVFSVITGAVGFFFRTKEIAEVVNDGSGYAVRGSKITIIIIALFLITAIVAIVSSLAIFGRGKAKASRGEGHILKSNAAGLIISCIAGLGIAIGAAVIWATSYRLPTAAMVELILAILSGIGIILVSRWEFKGGKSSSAISFCTIIPIIYFCFRMLNTYHQNSSNPVLLSFCWIVMALAAVCVAAYFRAGFVYNKPKPAAYVASASIAIFFSTMMLAEYSTSGMLILTAAIDLWLFSDCVFAIRGMKKAK